ncbi:MAG TPA: RNA polymerase sigma-54 factor [bacterium]|mgnify:CR=1 FL=1|nr:RNA polymerase sigma-54 factor [bacterium]
MTPSGDLNIQQAIRQELGLKLTPEMMLRIDVLQATHLELADILNRELQENPLIDEVVFQGDEAENEKNPNDESRAGEEDGAGAQSEKTEEIDLDGREARMDEINGEDYRNVFDADTGYTGQYEKENIPEFEGVNDRGYSGVDLSVLNLQEYLIKQINESKISDEYYMPVYAVISFIGDNGLLAEPAEKIAEESGIEQEKILKAIELLKSLDLEPAGAGAKDVRESLMMQMRKKAGKESLEYRILDLYFPLFLKKESKKLASVFGVREDDVVKAIDSIKRLKLYPGENFSGDEEIRAKISGRISKIQGSEYVSPDIIIEEGGDGGFSVRIVGEMPEIKTNKELWAEYKANEKTKDFIKGYENRIKALVSAVQDRNNTIKAVVERIVAIQKDFLENEEAGLKPLTLKEIALDAGLSESTVSRIVSSKYIQMPYGVLPLKSLFASRLSSDGGNVSGSAIQDRVKRIIETEGGKKPLTDTEITKILNGQGIHISRRTVTKYREKMNILPANMRSEINP